MHQIRPVTIYLKPLCVPRIVRIGGSIGGRRVVFSAWKMMQRIVHEAVCVCLIQN